MALAFYQRKNNLKFILSFVFTTLFAFVVSFFFVWWSIVIVSFVVHAVFSQKPLRSFVSGFCSVFLLWAGLSLFLTLNNHHILEKRISTLFFATYLPFVLNLVTGCVGGLVSGLGALCASHATHIWMRKNITQHQDTTPQKAPPLPTQQTPKPDQQVTAAVTPQPTVQSRTEKVVQSSYHTPPQLPKLASAVQFEVIQLNKNVNFITPEMVVRQDKNFDAQEAPITNKEPESAPQQEAPIESVDKKVKAKKKPKKLNMPQPSSPFIAPSINQQQEQNKSLNKL